MTSTDSPARAHIPDEISVVNVGLSLFASAIRQQERPVVDVDWRIPGGGDPQVVAALRRCFGPHTAVLDAANEEVVRRLDRGAPKVVGVRPAGEVVPVLAERRVILHCGPSIEAEGAAAPVRRSVRRGSWPSLSARGTAPLLRRTTVPSSPSHRSWYAIAAFTRGAVSASIQRMSSGATKCHVGRRT